MRLILNKYVIVPSLFISFFGLMALMTVASRYRDTKSHRIVSIEKYKTISGRTEGVSFSAPQSQGPVSPLHHHSQEPIKSSTREKTAERSKKVGSSQNPSMDLSEFNHTWSDCSDPDDLIKIHDVIIEIKQPVNKYDKSIIYAKAKVTVDKVITNATLHLKLDFAGFSVFNRPLDICDVLWEAGLDCPLEPGTFTLSINEPVSYGIPKVSQ